MNPEEIASGLIGQKYVVKIDFDSYLEWIDREDSFGEKTGIAPIDNIQMFTWKKGFLYCFTGWPGHGKSELLNSLLISKSNSDNWKWKIYSPENYPVEDYIATLSHTYLEQSVYQKNYNRPSVDEIRKAFNWIVEHFSFIDVSGDNIEDAMQNINLPMLIRDLSTCDGLLIDPFNAIPVHGDKYLWLMNALTMLKKTASTKKKAIVCVEHPAGKPRTDSGELIEPDQFKIAYGNLWNQKCDVIAVTHRPFIDDGGDMSYVVDFTTKKIKNHKLNGQPGSIRLKYDWKRNGYVEHVDDSGGLAKPILSIKDKIMGKTKENQENVWKSANGLLDFDENIDEPNF